MIYVEDKLIKVGGVVLPGLLKSIEITETAKIDEQEVEGSSTKPKQATGYEDAKISIELIIDDVGKKTKYQKLETIRHIFKKPGQKVPKPISISSKDTSAHGISKVIFKSLSHKVESKKDQISVTIEFVQYVSQTIKTKKKNSSKSSKSKSKSKNTKLTTKREKSPAKDDASNKKALERIKRIPG